MTGTDTDLIAETAARVYGDRAIVESFGRLARYCRGQASRALDLPSTGADSGSGAMPSRLRELCAVGAGVVLKQSNPAPEWHAKRAVQEGGTVREVSEVISLCVMLGGMITYRESGRIVLRAAEEESKRLKRGGERFDEPLPPPITDLDKALEYARGYYRTSSIVEDFELLARFVPDVLIGYFRLRDGVFRAPPLGSLPRKEKELIVVSIECAARKNNPPPQWHAARAVDEGATVAEVAEAVSVSLSMAGVTSFLESGRFALAAAEQRATEAGARSESAEDGGVGQGDS